MQIANMTQADVDNLLQEMQTTKNENANLHVKLAETKADLKIVKDGVFKILNSFGIVNEQAEIQKINTLRIGKKIVQMGMGIGKEKGEESLTKIFEPMIPLVSKYKNL